LESHEAEHLLLVDVVVVLDVPVLPVEAGAGHRSHVVGVGVALQHLVPHVKGIMRAESPLQELEAQTVLDDGGTECVPHPDALLLSILAGGSLHPVPGHEITVHSVPNVEEANHNHPHTERAVTVNRVLLEIPVHLV
jgi:hypothetical protein